MLTFEQFQATRREETDPMEMMNLSGHCEGEVIHRCAHVYDGDCWIMEYLPGIRDKKYWLNICIEEWEEDDLAKLERILYDEHYVSECQ